MSWPELYAWVTNEEVQVHDAVLAALESRERTAFLRRVADVGSGGAIDEHRAVVPSQKRSKRTDILAPDVSNDARGAGCVQAPSPAA